MKKTSIVFALLMLALNSNSFAANGNYQVVKETIHVPLKQEYPVFFTNTVVQVVEKIVEKRVEVPVEKIVEKRVEVLVERTDKSSSDIHLFEHFNLRSLNANNLTALHIMVFIILAVVVFHLFLFAIIFLKIIISIFNKIKKSFKKMASDILEEVGDSDIEQDLEEISKPKIAKKPSTRTKKTE